MCDLYCPAQEKAALIETRWSTIADAQGLADLHRDAWRHAYAGIIPGLAIERMVAARGPNWWRRMHGAGMRALVADHAGRLAGYATLGRGRGKDRTPAGEIYELYLRPEYQGVGLGRELFTAARCQLGAHGLRHLHVWALADNTAGCRFYAALGGEAWARAPHRIGGRELEKIGFRWL